MDDGIVLSLMFLIVFSGFCTEGLRLLYFRPEMMDWSPVGHTSPVLRPAASMMTKLHTLLPTGSRGSPCRVSLYFYRVSFFEAVSHVLCTDSDSSSKARQERLKTILHD